MAGQTKIAGLHVEQERINRMLEVLLHDNRSIGQWKSMDVRQKILTSFAVDEQEYSRNQVIYDLRKLRAHGLVKKLHRTNRYRLTAYGVKIALAFTLMRKRIYGPLHYSLFENQPDQSIATGSKLERLYRRLDNDINEIQEYLAA
jgi:nucleotidyltransferase/DNA polymerase involved in DNA repair